MASTRTEFHPRHLLDVLNRYRCEGAYRVAFSGGADSSALLLAMSELRGELPRSLSAVHINHGFHADADDWERHCRTFCQGLEIALQCMRVEPDPLSGRGPEAELRTVRYGAFAQLLEPGDLLLLAHHRDDQVETVLLNLLRGSGVEGLAGIPEFRDLGRGGLARPLLGWSRSQLQDFLVSRHAGWLEDPGNLDPGPDRNYLRLEVLPLLRSRWPAADRTLARSADHCQEAWTLLRSFARERVTRNLCNPRVLALHPGWSHDAPLLKLLLRLWISETGAPPVPRSRLEEFVRQLAESRGDAGVELSWNGWRLRRFQNRLWLHEEAEVPACPNRDWSGIHPLDLGHGLGILSIEGASGPILETGTRVGPRRRGAAIQLQDRGRQSVKELLRTAGIPPWLRSSIPVLDRDGELLAVGDWVLADEFSDHLNRLGARLRWTPRDPVLELVYRECHGHQVESAQPVG